jgi:hypothetical protein
MWEERLKDALAKGDASGALNVCEEYELEHCGGAAAETMLPFYRVQMMTYILDDLVNARWLWERMPAAVKGDKELEAAWGIALHLFKRNLKPAYEKLQSTPWKEPLLSMSKRTIEGLRSRNIKLMGESHCAIAVEECSAMLGLPPKEAAALCLKEGWEETDGFVRPTVPVDEVGMALRKEQLQELTEYVCHLDAR